MSARVKKQEITPEKLMSVLSSVEFDRWYKNKFSDHFDTSNPMRVSEKALLSDIGLMFGLAKLPSPTKSKTKVH